MPNLFIDSHCHFFSAKHIPLTQSIQRIQNQLFGSTAKKVAAGPVLTTLSPIFPFAGVIADDLIDRVIPFIQFFDTDAVYSLDQTLTSISTIPDMDIDNRLKIFTPLVMDFEQCVSYKRLSEQVKDLKDNITQLGSDYAHTNYLILPFMGIDFRRFDNVAADAIASSIDSLIQENVGSALKQFTLDTLETAENGDFIGIKLYPSLGSDLWPSENTAQWSEKRARNIEVVKALSNLSVPVTTHCQEGSYKCGDPNKKDKVLVNYASPQKWLSLLKASEVIDIRLNLAHFGGEDGVGDMFMWWDNMEETTPYDHTGVRVEASWTYWIIKILKTYPNAYSDLGAFNFDDQRGAASLLWLLHLDNLDQLGIEGPYKLMDKLLWGTDIPMTLVDYQNYAQQYDAFMSNTNLTRMRTDLEFEYDLPPADSVVSDHNNLVETLVNKNPSKFLFE